MCPRDIASGSSAAAKPLNRDRNTYRVATLMTSIPNTPGVGLRLAHLAEMVTTRPACGWLEVHPENFLANPHAPKLLIELSAHYPISLHTVGFSVGGAPGIDKEHLRRFGDLEIGLGRV